jgi:hypothetical protein
MCGEKISMCRILMGKSEKQRDHLEELGLEGRMKINRL